MSHPQQGTVAREVVFEGVGIHTGTPSAVTVCPAPPNRGRVFITSDGTEIPARVDHVVNCDRSTILGKGEQRVHTPEHLLSALSALDIDNAELRLEGQEVPILEGSAQTFFQELQSAGREAQGTPPRVVELDRPYTYGNDRGALVLAYPHPKLEYEYVLHYDHPMLGCQRVLYRHGCDDYGAEIAPSRTFALWEEIKPLLDRGMALGGSLDNALVVYQDRFSSPLKIPNEPAAHKCLDLVGDLALLDARLLGRVIGVKAGHKLHVECAKLIWEEALSNSNL